MLPVIISINYSLLIQKFLNFCKKTILRNNYFCSVSQRSVAGYISNDVFYLIVFVKQQRFCK